VYFTGREGSTLDRRLGGRRAVSDHLRSSGTRDPKAAVYKAMVDFIDLGLFKVGNRRR
jgi:hypothetical protein